MLIRVILKFLNEIRLVKFASQVKFVSRKNTLLKNSTSYFPSVFLTEILSKLVIHFLLFTSIRGNSLCRIVEDTRHAERNENHVQKVEAIPRGFGGARSARVGAGKKEVRRQRTGRARAPRRAGPSSTYVAVKNGLGKGTPGATARAGRVIK